MWRAGLLPKRVSSVVLATGCILLWGQLVLFLPAVAGVTIHCLDVGQGDCTLVVSSSGQSMIIDGGDDGLGVGVVVPYLMSLGIEDLDYMVATHYHADHIGGLDEIFHYIGVQETVFDRGGSYSTAAYYQYALMVSSKRRAILEGQVIDLGDGVTVTCLGLNGNGVIPPPHNDPDWENEYSIALLVECGDFDFFVAGDLIGINYNEHRDIETSIAPEAGEVEVYQVNHQCSYTSSNAFFLNTIKPEVAIVSLGENPFGHPHQEVLNRLANRGAFVYQTEPGDGGTLPPQYLRVVNGHIVITTDGYGDYIVDGDTYAMDEDDITAIPIATRFHLLGNFPNPFNPSTNILFESAGGGPSVLTIFDLAGRKVFEEHFLAGPGLQTHQWHGRDSGHQPVPSGVFFYRITTPEGEGTGRMSLVKSTLAFFS
jgi:beta-lactamase superfamily II metal-dependent hydrolase